jgi:hypothetical protein
MNSIPEALTQAVSRRQLLQAGSAASAGWCLPGTAFLISNKALAQEGRAQPAIKTVANFDAGVWRQLLASGPRPAAYVFTTTYCPSCPAVVAQLARHIRRQGRQVTLAAVVMDMAGDAALASLHHYAGITQVFAFDGFEPAIRHAVDPNWPNVTPYTVLVSRTGQLQRVIGPPDPSLLQRWLA